MNEHNQTWRVLEATFDEGIDTHCVQQRFYFISIATECSCVSTTSRTWPRVPLRIIAMTHDCSTGSPFGRTGGSSNEKPTASPYGTIKRVDRIGIGRREPRVFPKTALRASNGN